MIFHNKLWTLSVAALALRHAAAFVSQSSVSSTSSPSFAVNAPLPRRRLTALPRSSLYMSSTDDDDAPTDVESDDEDVTQNEPESNVTSPSDSDVVEVDEDDEEEEEDLLEEALEDLATTFKKATGISTREAISLLQTLGAIASRGETATPSQVQAARDAVQVLEEATTKSLSDPTSSPKIQGTWELVFTDCGCGQGGGAHLFRSSPFFLAGRAACTTPEEATRYDWFCTMHRKALSISTIGPVRQIVSRTRLVSEFEVDVGAVPFLSDFTPFRYSGGAPVSITGAIVSSADLTAINETAWEMYMDTVEVKGSNIPGVRQALDAGVQLQSRMLSDVLEQNVPDYKTPKPILRTTYLTEKFRITRDMDDNFFVYVKTSDSTQPTDYSTVDADLGVARLLEGFNDAVTQFYI